MFSIGREGTDIKIVELHDQSQPSQPCSWVIVAEKTNNFLEQTTLILTYLHFDIT